MFVCLCADKCEEDIKEIMDQGVFDVDEISEITGAGTGCGTCKLWIKRMVDEKIISS